MSSRPPLVFKFASEDWEFEEIHRLNYKTFVEEIPQHKASPTQRLVDKFHSENTYLICLCGRKLAGMLAVRGSRPFSLDQKLENLERLWQKAWRVWSRLFRDGDLGSIFRVGCVPVACLGQSRALSLLLRRPTRSFPRRPG